jgi:hypothetical protein
MMKWLQPLFTALPVLQTAAESIETTRPRQLLHPKLFRFFTLTEQ